MSHLYQPTVLSRFNTGTGAGSKAPVSSFYDVRPDKIFVEQNGAMVELTNITSSVLDYIETEFGRCPTVGYLETHQRLLAYAYKNGCKEYWDKYKDTPLALKALEEIA